MYQSNFQIVDVDVEGLFIPIVMATKTTAQQYGTLKSPKPSKLSKNATFEEFSHWLKNVKVFVKYNNIEVMDVELQQTIFLGFVDDYLTRMINSHFENLVCNNIFDEEVPNSWISKLASYFETLFPIHSRLVNFFMQKQRHGESTSVFLKSKKSEAVHFSSHPEVTDDRFQDYLIDDHYLYKGPQKVGNVETLEFGERQIDCDYVQRIVHARYDVTGPVVMDDPLKTPLIWIQICDKSAIGDVANMARVQAIPDSGAMVPIIGKNIADQLGLRIDSSRRGDIRTANGTPLETLGAVDIKAHYRGVKIMFTAFVTTNQRAGHPYLCWRNMKRFRILHPDFPLPIQECGMSKIDRVLPSINLTKQDLVLDSTEEVSEVFPQEVQDIIDVRIKDFKKEFAPVFDVYKNDNMIKAPPMKLVLRDDVPITPYVTKTARSTPFALRDSANREIQNYLRTGVLRRPRPNEKITWLAPGMFIPKPSGDGARLIVCGQKLNEFIIRQPHQFQPPLDLLRSIPPGQKFFMTLDCYRGYFQIPLAEEDQAKTAFLLKEHGIMIYQTAPMGCTASSDYFCKITDEIIAPCKNVLKLIDDILLYASTLDELFANFRHLLERCALYNLTLNPLKLKIARRLKFGGYEISEKGIHVTDEKVEVIKNFQAPKTLTDVRSFIGCCLQFKYHAPNLMGHLQPIIALTSTKGEVVSNMYETPVPKKKSRPIVWTDFHQQHFEKVKDILTSASGNVLTNYDSSKTLYIYTDASRDKGIGFCAIQFHDEHPKLIECGSQTISDCARNSYSVSELECLAIIQALTKLRLYTVANSNIVVRTDHQALVGMKNKTLDQLETARLCKMFEKMAAFQFKIEFIKGKKNAIADFCSRYPIDGAPVTEFDGHTVNEIVLDSVEQFEGSHGAINLESFRKAAKICPEYTSIRKLLLSGCYAKDLPVNHVGRLYRQHWDQFYVDGDLILFDGRILVPKAILQEVLQSLHIAHLGIAKTKFLARKLYIWHNMKTHIEQMIDTCEKCQVLRPILPAEPLINTIARFPMECVSIDVGENDGKRFLVMSDRYSGFLWAKILKKIASKDIIRTLKDWYTSFGYPWSLRSDGAKNFVSYEMEQFFKAHGCDHEVSSAYFAQANGHAESAIKTVKSFVKKCKNDDQLQDMIMEYNCCPLASGALSPMDTMFRHRRKSKLPMTKSQAVVISDQELKKSENLKQRFRDRTQKSKKTRRQLFALKVNTPVRIFDVSKNCWSQRGLIVAIGDTPRAYKVLTEQGHVTHRNRKFLKVDKTAEAFQGFERLGGGM